ncbi:hypothetical protein DPEC_G00361860 [Dallia pectoralis]|nr:hypothetical protein DPEC_G00361860 [Dallia pectoralis]
MALFVAACLLTALWASARASSVKPETLRDESNLQMCRPDRDYCSERHNPPFALVECIDNNIGLCRHRCPLGRPSLPNTVTAGRRAPPCVRRVFPGEATWGRVCLLHRVSCPHGQTVILLGTSCTTQFVDIWSITKYRTCRPM